MVGTLMLHELLLHCSSVSVFLMGGLSFTSLSPSFPRFPSLSCFCIIFHSSPLFRSSASIQQCSCFSPFHSFQYVSPVLDTLPSVLSDLGRYNSFQPFICTMLPPFFSFFPLTHILTRSFFVVPSTASLSVHLYTSSPFLPSYCFTLLL